MSTTRKQVTSLAAALYATAMVAAALPLVAEEIDVAERESRLEYDRDNAPMGVRLMMFLKVYGIHQSNVEGRMQSRLSSMGIKNEDIPTLTVYFEHLYEQIQAEIDEGHRQSACHDGASKLRGDDLGALLNSFDDVRFETYEKYAASVDTFMAGLGYSGFSARLEAEMTGFGVHSSEFKSHVIGREQEYQELRAKLCEKLRSVTSNTPASAGQD